MNAFEHEVTSAAEKLNGTIKTVVALNDDNVQRCRDTVSSIELLTRKLTELGEITQQIESFVGVITDVSRKTKLLALNATIEAARSGEYGRGFSVVANEVKALAIEAEEATKRVTRQATEIQAAIAGAIQQVDGSQKLVQAIDQGVATESLAIRHQSTAVVSISTNLNAMAHTLRDQLTSTVTSSKPATTAGASEPRKTITHSPALATSPRPTLPVSSRLNDMAK